MRNRLEVYREQTQPLVNHYAKNGVLVNVDGDPLIDEVTQDLMEAIGREL